MMKIILVFPALFLISLSSVYGLEVPKFQGFVNDYAGIISPETKSKIEKDLRTLEEADSTQIFILTVPSLEGEVLEEFAIKVFDAWKAGQKKLDNGVILIIAQKERKIRIEVGRGLEGKLTDLESGRIIDQVMKPKFKEGDFNGGFIDGVSSLVSAAKGEFRTAAQDKPEDSDVSMFYNLVSIFMQRPEEFMRFFYFASILICLLPILTHLDLLKRQSFRTAAGAAGIPVIAFFTIWHPVFSLPLIKYSLLALIFYVVTGGVIAALTRFVSDSARSSGSGGSGGGSSWSGSSGGSSSSCSGGGGGSSGGGGASGDY